MRILQAVSSQDLPLHQIREFLHALLLRVLKGFVPINAIFSVRVVSNPPFLGCSCEEHLPRR